MAQSVPGDIGYCKELACATGSTLASSHRFARPGFRSRLIVLHAFLQSVGSIPFRLRDPEIALAKLAWWREELSAASFSQHPLIVAIRDFGVENCLAQPLVDEHFTALARLGSGEPISTQEQLEHIADRLGGSAARMEAGLDGAAYDGHELVKAGAAMFLAKMILNPRATLCAQAWWLPMELQARHGITLGDVERGHSDGALLRALNLLGGPVREALDQFASALPALVRDTRRNPGIHHLGISAALLRNRLARLEKGGIGRLDRPPAAVRELFTAWWKAVRI